MFRIASDQKLNNYIFILHCDFYCLKNNNKKIFLHFICEKCIWMKFFTSLAVCCLLTERSIRNKNTYRHELKIAKEKKMNCFVLESKRKKMFCLNKCTKSKKVLRIRNFMGVFSIRIYFYMFVLMSSFLYMMAKQ